MPDQRSERCRSVARRAFAEAKNNGDVGTMRRHLRELEHVECGRVLLVRRITRLGFDSEVALERHLKQFGAVDRVMVAHSHVKGNPLLKTRQRPGSLAFVVMKREAYAEAALRAGETQLVRGTEVVVTRFQMRHCATEALGAEATEDGVEDGIDEHAEEEQEECAEPVEEQTEFCDSTRELQDISARPPEPSDLKREPGAEVGARFSEASGTISPAAKDFLLGRLFLGL